jgi:hypothetical protein
MRAISQKPVSGEHRKLGANRQNWSSKQRRGRMLELLPLRHGRTVRSRSRKQKNVEKIAVNGSFRGSRVQEPMIA